MRRREQTLKRREGGIKIEIKRGGGEKKGGLSGNDTGLYHIDPACHD